MVLMVLFCNVCINYNGFISCNVVFVKCISLNGCEIVLLVQWLYNLY